MPEYNSKGQRLLSVVRVLEYHGTEAWVQKVMEASRIPLQGEFKGHESPLPEGCWIRSGLVNWNIEGEQEAIPVIPVPPGATH